MSLQDLFEMLDVNRDGRLTLQDFKQVVSQLVGRRLTDNECEIIFRTLDKQGKGVLQREEIISGLELVDTWDASGFQERCKAQESDVDAAKSMAFAESNE